MTPQELKNSILQLAIQGKLVEQRPEEGTAEELYQQIQAARVEARGPHASTTRGSSKRALPPITDDEKPFDIPESWKWVRLNEVATSGLGKTLNKATDSGKICRYLCSINVYWDGIKLDTVKEAPFTEADREKYLLQKGDLLICEGGDAGRCAVWNSDEEMYYQNALHRVRFYGDISVEYFRAIFELYKGTGIIKKHCKGETIQHLVQAELYSILFPLPPLAEQKRIVAKIEELLPLIDRYDAAWSRLEAFNKRFPGDMQKSLLQMAIQGKLVEQRPEEGTGEELFLQIQAEKQALIKAGKIKKDKPLPEIAEDEKPFDIPESWKWGSLGRLGYKVTDGTHRTPKYTASGVKFVSAKNLYSGVLCFDNCKYISEEEHRELYSRCNPELGDILISKSGSIGTVAIVNVAFEFSTFESLALVKYNQRLIDTLYLRYAIQNACYHLSDENIRGVAVKHLPIADIQKMQIPLPPLAEQKRIVAKLEALLPLCERLK